MENFKEQIQNIQDNNDKDQSTIEDFPLEQYNQQQDKAITLTQIKNQQQTNHTVQYKQYRLTACLEATKYPVVHLCCGNHFKLVSKDENFNLYWYDWDVEEQFFQELLPYQKVNHWPSMYNITRKDTLARNLNRAFHFLPDLYNFYPKTFYLPTESSLLQKFIQQSQKQQVFILKPPASAQGRGIKLFDSLQQIDIDEQGVVQEYIDNPYLIDGYKFDLRIYVVLLQVVPFPVIVWYNDGMGRLCTDKYQKPNKQNMSDVYMHLTNYALNKQNETYVKNKNAQQDDIGSKQSLSAVLERIQKDGGNSNQIISDIQDICIKTIFTILPTLQQSYASLRPGFVKLNTAQDPYIYQNMYFGSNCFEILGFDILITNDFKCKLIEVNHSPSFSCDTELDLRIKKRLIDGVLSMIDCQQSDKIVYKDICEGKFDIQNIQAYQYQKQQTIIPESYIRNFNGKKMKIQTKTLKSVLQHYQDVIDQSNGLFKLIYPLEYGKKDIYRDILFKIKNNFVGESTVKLYNKFIPVMPKDYFSENYQQEKEQQKQNIQEQMQQQKPVQKQQKLKQQQKIQYLTYQEKVEFGNPNAFIKLQNNQNIPLGTPLNIQQTLDILDQRLQILQQKGYDYIIDEIFNQINQQQN